MIAIAWGTIMPSQDDGHMKRCRPKWSRWLTPTHLMQEWVDEAELLGSDDGEEDAN